MLKDGNEISPLEQSQKDGLNKKPHKNLASRTLVHRRDVPETLVLDGGPTTTRKQARRSIS